MPQNDFKILPLSFTRQLAVFSLIALYWKTALFDSNILNDKLYGREATNKEGGGIATIESFTINEELDCQDAEHLYENGDEIIS